ncbi:MAG: helix-turn-helix domain-containing protein [Lachnospiraceae bacterium]|nr:helix-turn-helix domain-containing protein [Lachnospiraceae bacterium]
MLLDGNILIENIRMLCKKNKVSMSKLESDLFLSPGLISRWNKSIPALDKVMTIAEYFGVSVDDLVGRPKSNLSHTNIERLLILLYNRSMIAEIDWDILNFQNPPEKLADIMPSDLFETDSCSCYFASFRNGFFLLAAAYSFDNNLLLKLFTFPDIHSRPECICTDVNMLHQLYEYLDRRFSRKLNNIKSDNFINAFIEDATKALTTEDFPVEDGKITPLRNINDASNF